MTAVIMHDLDLKDVKVGDEVLGFEAGGTWHDRMGDESWTVEEADGSWVCGTGKDGRPKSLGSLARRFKVLRVLRKATLITTKPIVQGTVNLGSPKIPDWPLLCPSCKRPDSAVLLFMGYDCRHGCYK